MNASWGTANEKPWEQCVGVSQPGLWADDEVRAK